MLGLINSLLNVCPFLGEFWPRARPLSDGVPTSSLSHLLLEVFVFTSIPGHGGFCLALHFFKDLDLLL